MASMNSIITLIAEDIVFYTVFGILFYVDNINKRKNGYSVEQNSATLNNTRFENIKRKQCKIANHFLSTLVHYRYFIE